MKKVITIVLILSFILTLFCSCKKESENILCSNELFLKAEAILDELPEDKRIDDFRKIHKILTSLSTNEKQFLRQLESARVIAEQYDFSLESADWYFNSLSPINTETINDYINRRIEHDISNALNGMIAPLLYKEYADDVNHIRNLSKDDILNTIQNLGYYRESTKYKDKRTECIKEIWTCSHSSDSNYEVNHYENGFVEWVQIPLLKTEAFKTSDEWENLYNENEQRQEEIVKDNVDEMIQSFSGFANEREVLSLIYTEEELNFLEKYIKTLDSEYLWSNSAATTFGGILMLSYKDTNIYITFGLRTIKLDVSGTDNINGFSSRWYTLEAGFAGTAEHRKFLEEEYADYINNNEDADKIIPNGVIDLNKIDENDLIENSEEESESVFEMEGFDSDSDIAENINGDGIKIALAPENYYTNPDDYETYIFEGLKYGDDVVLIPDTQLNDFKFFSINSEKFTLEDKYEISETLYSKDKLNREKPFVVRIYIAGPGGPYYGISYVDGNGNMRQFVIMESGEDGSFFLYEV